MLYEVITERFVLLQIDYCDLTGLSAASGKVDGIQEGPVAQFWLERTPDTREVDGSSPSRPTIFGVQLSGDCLA